MLREEALGDIPVVLLADDPGLLEEAGLASGDCVLLVRPISPLTLATAVVGILTDRLDQRPDGCVIVERDQDTTGA